MLSSQSKKMSSKRMRRRERGDVLEAMEIPLDLQIEILNRLPIKSLARFKCVSKLWSSLITSKGYFFVSSPRLYITSVVEEIHCSPEKFVLLSLKSTRISNTVFYIDSTMDGIRGYMVALRGLILFKFRGQACIYNPTTGQRVTLPAVEFNIPAGTEFVDLHDYFLGYDPVLDQYKVVCTTVAGSIGLPRNIYTQHWWVYVLEAGSSWKRIEFDHPHIPFSPGLCINGVIYYLADCLVDGRIVISFDLRSEEFNMIQVPSVVYEYFNSLDLDLIEYDGKLTIFDCTHLHDQSGLLNLWVLEDGGKWSNKSLVLQSCQKHLVPRSIYFRVIGTTQNGEVVLKPHRMMPYSNYILYYDLYKNDVRRVDIIGISKEPFALALMDTGKSIMHLKI